MQLSDVQLRAIMPGIPQERLLPACPALSEAMTGREINTLNRAAAFLGQLSWESGDLKYLQELASGEAYEGRLDLGNTEPGDGPRYKGRGPIQLTGRSNYRRAGVAIGIDLVRHPQRAAELGTGCRIAAWYWDSRGINYMADNWDLRRVTRAINGGYNHHDRRVERIHRAVEILRRTATLA